MWLHHRRLQRLLLLLHHLLQWVKKHRKKLKPEVLLSYHCQQQSQFQLQFHLHRHHLLPAVSETKEVVPKKEFGGSTSASRNRNAETNEVHKDKFEKRGFGSHNIGKAAASAGTKIGNTSAAKGPTTGGKARVSVADATTKASEANKREKAPSLSTEKTSTKAY